MRTRFLSAIISFLLVSIALGSCLDSEETTAYSSDATIHAFSLDTIHGVDYKFEIDQLNNLIYNLDSMPVDADTLIDSIQIDQISVAWTVTSADTVLNTEAYHNLLPAMNATGSDGIKLKVYAPDGVTTRDYTLQIRVHRQDPDSLVWTRMDHEGDPVSQTVNQEEQKVVILNDELLLYTSTAELYRTSTAPGQYGWNRQSVTGLPEEADITTLINFDDRLYILADGSVYSSDVTGTSWEEATGLSGNVLSLLANIPSNDITGKAATLAGIRLNEAREQEFCITTDGQSWTSGNAVPADFPTQRIYYANYTTGSRVRQTIITGMPRNNEEKTIPWMTTDGTDWAALETTTENASCPGMDNPFIMRYNNRFYAFGGSMEDIYESETGIAWQEIKRKFLLPPSFAGKTSYTVAVDHTPEGVTAVDEKRDFIWVIFGGNGTATEVWRGRLNKLGFERE